MAHDGPSGIWRWRGGANTGAVVDVSDVSLARALPQVSQADKPEGLTVLDHRGGATSVLVVYDAPVDARKIAPTGVRADVFRL
jgi:hypothetical protein